MEYCCVGWSLKCRYTRRFDPIYHIAADEMKTVYKNMREEERQRAELFQNLSLERTRRRVREWSIRALKKRRIQLLKVCNPQMQIMLLFSVIEITCAGR